MWRRTCEFPMVLPEPYFSSSDSWDTSCAIRFFSEPIPQLRDSWDKHMVLPQTKTISIFHHAKPQILLTIECWGKSSILKIILQKTYFDIRYTWSKCTLYAQHMLSNLQCECWRGWVTVTFLRHVHMYMYCPIGHPALYWQPTGMCELHSHHFLIILFWG